MKKLMTILVAAVTAAVLTFPAAAAQQDTYKLYKAAMDELSNCSSMDLTGTVKTTMKTGDSTFSIPATFTCQVINDSNGNMQFALTETTTILDEDTINSKYYKDGYLYEYTDGKQTKRTKMSAEKAVQQTKIPVTFDKETMKDAVLTDVEQGRQIQIKGRDEQFSHTFSYLLGENGSLIAYKSVTTPLKSNGGVKMTTNVTVQSLNKITSLPFPADLG